MRFYRVDFWEGFGILVRFVLDRFLYIHVYIYMLEGILNSRTLSRPLCVAFKLVYFQRWVLFNLVILFCGARSLTAVIRELRVDSLMDEFWLFKIDGFLCGGWRWIVWWWKLPSLNQSRDAHALWEGRSYFLPSWSWQRVVLFSQWTEGKQLLLLKLKRWR